MPTRERTYVHHTFTAPTVLPEGLTEDDFVKHAAAHLRLLAGEQGLALAGDPEMVRREDGGIMDTDSGPVAVQRVTFRAETTTPPQFAETRVDAVERPDGTWAADVDPGYVIVSVIHGLGSLSVTVHAEDGAGRGTGIRGFVPITEWEVEVSVMPSVRRLVIEALPEETGD